MVSSKITACMCNGGSVVCAEILIDGHRNGQGALISLPFLIDLHSNTHIFTIFFPEG